MKKHVANQRHLRLTATVWGGWLQLFIPTNCSQIAIRYPSGDLALIVTSTQASRLAQRGMVAGHVNRDSLRYLILRAPKSTVVRVLSLDPPRCPSDITTARQPDMRWAVRLDRAKLGRMGGPPKPVWHRMSA